jgi:hypothetical protein
MTFARKSSRPRLTADRSSSAPPHPARVQWCNLLPPMQVRSESCAQSQALAAYRLELCVGPTLLVGRFHTEGQCILAASAFRRILGRSFRRKRQKRVPASACHWTIGAKNAATTIKISTSRPGGPSFGSPMAARPPSGVPSDIAGDLASLPQMSRTPDRNIDLAPNVELILRDAAITSVSRSSQSLFRSKK